MARPRSPPAVALACSGAFSRCHCAETCAGCGRRIGAVAAGAVRQGNIREFSVQGSASVRQGIRDRWGEVDATLLIGSSTWVAQQRRQLGDVDGDALRLVAGEQPGCNVRCPAESDIPEERPPGLLCADFVAEVVDFSCEVGVTSFEVAPLIPSLGARSIAPG